MKKVLITLSIVLISLIGYSQVTNVGEFRIANATTTFGVNLPVGTKIYNIATGEYWVATAGVASTATLTTASASFELLNNAGTDDQTASEVNVTATGNLSATNVQSALEELQGDIDGIADTDDQTLSIDSTAGRIFTISIENGNSVSFKDSILTESDVEAYINGNENSFNGWDKDASDDFDGDFTSLSNIPSGIADGDDVNDADYDPTNEIQTIDTARLVGTTLELSLSSDGEAKKEIDLSSLQDGTGTDDQSLSYNSGTHAIDIEDGTSAVLPLALDDGATEGLASFTASDFTVTSGNVAIDYVNGQAATNSQPGFATSTHITAIESNTSDISTNTGNISTNASDISALEAIAKSVTQKFEVGSNSATATTYTLSVAAATSQACIVSYNGVVLDPSSDYVFASSTSLQINVPVYQYDKIVILYKTAL